MKNIKEKIKGYYEISRGFLREVWVETAPPYGKVSWPTRKIVIGSTIVVIIAVLIFALYLAIVDYLFSSIMLALVGGR
ncbi:MAG: preprotein translocase subunit SecE [bacterium]|nr:preprotein translocase subunit SecE [bacterium]